MKVGVLTFHRCINYGSYWQARCLVEGLRRRGLEAVLLDHRSAAVDRAEWNCALRPLRPARSSRADIAAYSRKARSFLRAVEALPRSAPFALDAPDLVDSYDLVVIGSDEVWNLSHPWYGGRALFFGQGVKAARRISYAASVGGYEPAAGLPACWTELLRGLDRLSVRDENSRRLVSETVGVEPNIVLDPCLAFPPRVRPQGQGSEPYVLVYGHDFPAGFGAAARAWAVRRGLRLVSVGYRNDWADEQRLSDGPEAFAAAMAGASAVATNFFHGCVFALLNAKPFACTTMPYRASKVRALLSAIGQESRLVADGEATSAAFAAAVERPHDTAVDERLARLRRGSEGFLDAAIA